MPMLEHYEVEVVTTVTITGGTSRSVVQRYEARGRAKGTSAGAGLPTTIETAVAQASAQSRIIGAGVDNAEKRRLK